MVKISNTLVTILILIICYYVYLFISIPEETDICLTNCNLGCVCTSPMQCDINDGVCLFGNCNGVCKLKILGVWIPVDKFIKN